MKNYDLYCHEPFYTLKDLLVFCADKYDGKTVFLYKKKNQIIKTNFNDFFTEVKGLGSYFFYNGYKNCHIAVYGENSYEWILTHFAVTCGRNVIVPIDKDIGAETIIELLKNSDCKVLVYSKLYSDVVCIIK